MRNLLQIAIPALFLAVSLQAAPQSQSQGTATPAGRTLKLKLNYTGSGVIDAKHPIFVFVFDSPDFQQGQLPPIAQDTATMKEQTLTFKDLTASPVYVAVIYDPTGEYQGDSMPPSGSIIAMYSKQPGVPAPINIDAGKTAEVELTFNDEHKMQ
jgi:hypothetical protein